MNSEFVVLVVTNFPVKFMCKFARVSYCLRNNWIVEISNPTKKNFLQNAQNNTAYSYIEVL